MSWLDRLRSRPGPEPEPRAPEEPLGRASPGLAALFARLEREGRHLILDLGDASSQQLSVLGSYARQIRFAGLTPAAPQGQELRAALNALPVSPEGPFDVILAWDVLDHLFPEDRVVLVRRLAELAADGASLYACVDTSGSGTKQPVRSTLVGVDRVAQEAVGPAGPAKPELLPAQAEKLLEPFVVTQAFSLRVGVREYVATKR